MSACKKHTAMFRLQNILSSYFSGHNKREPQCLLSKPCFNTTRVCRLVQIPKRLNVQTSLSRINRVVMALISLSPVDQMGLAGSQAVTADR